MKWAFGTIPFFFSWGTTAGSWASMHGFTSKVLPYEESIRVPMIIAGPGIEHGTDSHLVLNIDLAPTILELAKIPIPRNMHGESFLRRFSWPPIGRFSPTIESYRPYLTFTSKVI
ncbi:sulfatase/phosphatase domain-containing protein, partial [Planctomycetota bacterium]